MRDERDLKHLQDLAGGGRVEVTLPDLEGRLRGLLGATASVSLGLPGAPGSVRIITSSGATFGLLPSDADMLFNHAMGLPPSRAWARTIESARRRVEAVQRHQRGETDLLATRLAELGITEAELQLGADPELLRQAPELARAALAPEAERRAALQQFTTDVLAGWLRGYAPPESPASLVTWAQERLGLTLTVGVGVGLSLPRLVAPWPAGTPDLERAVLGVLRRAEVI